MMSARQNPRSVAAKNRKELIAAGFTRRDLVKMGLVTSAGWLVAKRGLSARAVNSAGFEDGQTSSPRTTPFIERLPIMPVKKSVPALSPAPTVSPQRGEGRRRDQQAFASFPPQDFYEMVQQPGFVSVSPDLPPQLIWGYDGISPGPTYVCHSGKSILVRNYNRLPLENGGFGKPSVSTHLHNGHTASECDGHPCDFFESGEFYDQCYPNCLAGGDPRESMSTLWYHDHRVAFTAQNVYKGLAGFYLLYNELDTGDETSGFRLPGVPNASTGGSDFDVPLLFGDKVFDPDDASLFFDLFNLDGILGDKFCVNGKIQPFFEVHPRRYRFRLLNGGPSRFYQFHLTDPQNLNTTIPFWQISNDGNLLPSPEHVTSTRLSVAERMDVIIDFSTLAGKSIYLENRLQQVDGRAPKDVLPAGAGNFVLRFDVVLPPVRDDSQDPSDPSVRYYDLPPIEPTVVTRRFKFDRTNGNWAINNTLFDVCTPTEPTPPRFRIKRGTAEKWIFQNNSGGWQHPIHIHFEEFQMLSRNGVRPPRVERGRKDVARLEFGEEIEVYFKFRDFVGQYPMHCHNVVHEDHEMMLSFEIDDEGDRRTEP
jgi:FtsP/CotA-like multicopper oxidase with cupredoxin domain